MDVADCDGDLQLQDGGAAEPEAEQPAEPVVPVAPTAAEAAALLEAEPDAQQVYDAHMYRGALGCLHHNTQ